VDGRKEPHVSTSTARRLKHAEALAEQAALDPSFADRLREVRSEYGDDWYPGSVLAKRLRAMRYAECVLGYVQDAADFRDDLATLPAAADYFAEVRELLATHCDPAYAELTFEQALGLLKPRRGPQGAAGVIARWTLATGAFGESESSDPAAVAKRFRGAARDARRPEHRARAR
jgi:hypothetical protein